jgi:hypothetical protein
VTAADHNDVEGMHAPCPIALRALGQSVFHVEHAWRGSARLHALRQAQGERGLMGRDENGSRA